MLHVTCVGKGHSHAMHGSKTSAVGSAYNRHNTYTQPFNGPLSGTTGMGRYKKQHSPAHTCHDYQLPQTQTKNNKASVSVVSGPSTG